jgi:hypothetical protein
MSRFTKTGSEDKKEGYDDRPDDTMGDLNEWIHVWMLI